MDYKITPTKVTATAALLTLAWALTGCASSDAPVAPSLTASPTAEPTAEPVTTPAPTEAPVALDTEFADVPLPSGHTVEASKASSGNGNSEATVHVPGPWEDTADFYREELPAAGWNIESEQPSDSGTGTTFTTTRDSTRGTFDVTDDGGDATVTIVLAQVATETPAPTETSAPAETTAPAETPTPVETPVPDETSVPAETPVPTETPVATEAQGAGECTDHTQYRLYPELPEGFPDLCIPLYSPSERAVGAEQGGGMWILEYDVSGGDLEEITQAILGEIDAEGWEIVDQSVEGKHHKYDLETPGYELVLVLSPEVTRDDVPYEYIALYYTLRTR